MPEAASVRPRASPPADEAPAPGISNRLARARSGVLSDLRYDLVLRIPPDAAAAVHGAVSIGFALEAPQDLVVDFAAPPGHVRGVRTSKGETPVGVAEGHLVVPGNATTAGRNEIAIDFIAGEEPLNRRDDLVYTLFVPARAHRVFPCFDQPNLKARLRLTLEVPADWQAVANGSAISVAPVPGGTRYRFAETPPLPTYLMSFAAGRFSVETALVGSRDLRLFHRDADRAKVLRNRSAIFDLHGAALDWLEGYTGIPYAFGKLDVLAIPSMQFSGMEHPGAILYNAGALLLDETATQNQRLDRATLIAHEVAHMWFGNLVTMPWFDDVWLKEVFATYLAGEIVNPSYPGVDHALRFFVANYPPAYQVDRTAGANPIRQELQNLDEAGELYGPIVYRKAPVAMRQLEAIVGSAPFRESVREYLGRHAFGNASWADLRRILDGRTPGGMNAWSRAWIEERGRPTVRVDVQCRSGRIRRLVVTTSDPLGRGLVWPQRLRVAVGCPDGLREITADITTAETSLREAKGLRAPRFVLPSGGGLGYGLFLLDHRSRSFLLAHAEELPDALTRAAALVTLWDNMLERLVAPAALVGALVRAAAGEGDEQNLQQQLSYLVRAFWHHLDPDERARCATAIERALEDGLERAPTRTCKAAWLGAYREIATTPGAIARLERFWRRTESAAGLPLAESDDEALALALAVRDVPSADEILAAQQRRSQDPDRQARLAFLMPAVSPDPAVREGAFERLRSAGNRRREPWVADSMTYLNHPLRAGHALRFLAPSLELLREIQRTGDIFFPARWIQAALSGHRSRAAAAIVRAFLAAEPDYPQRLRWLVLAAADDLFRVAGHAPAPPAAERGASA